MRIPLTSRCRARARFRFAIVVALALVASAPASAEDKRAFTIEDFYRVNTPSEIDVSPDGTRLVYALASTDLARGKRNHDLYLLDTRGGEPRRLTWTADVSETSPRWSPDGSAIAFVARRGENDQVWLLPASGGEARAVTNIATGVADPMWLPDGTAIAFVSRVHPECGADDACNALRLDARAEGPLAAHVADELLYRHWDSWGEHRVAHVLLVRIDSGRVVDLTPGPREAPLFAVSGGGFAITPDSARLVVVQNADQVETLARSTNGDLFSVAIGATPNPVSAAPVNLTASNPAWDGEPQVSPDGRYIAFLRQAVPGYESDLTRLALLDLATGAVRLLASEIVDPIETIAWMPDSQEIVFTKPHHGATPVFRVALDGSPAREVARLARIDELVISPRGRFAFVKRSAVGEPHEIWRIDLAGADAPVRLTHHNRELERDVDIRPAEWIWVEGAKGQPIQVFIVKPHGFDPAKRYPLILNVHGGPQMMWADSFRGDWQMYPGAGYVVAFPNPTGSTGYGHALTRAISGDYGGRVFDDLRRITDALAKLSFVDADRMGAMGWSWGGYAMAWLQGEKTPFKALASMMGIYDLSSFWGATEELWYPEFDLDGVPWESADYEKFSPSSRAAKFRTPMLIVTGERDFRVPYTESLQMFTVLRRQGVPARLVVLPNSGHWPGWYEMALYYTAHLEWFQRYLGGAAPPWTTEDFARNLVFDPKTGARRRSVEGAP
ncbi:MAG: S9 family peptidase [Acidobacteria bacterium]|nr:S9 family peptidase [Acidobacteriota bacterium]